MVKGIFLFFLQCLITLTLLADEIKVEVVLDNSSPQQGVPITGSLIITHPAKSKIETKSFSYEGKPLSADFLNKVEFAGQEPVFVETFRFSLPSFPVGLQVLKPISVKIAGKTFSTIPSSFEVKKLQELPQAPPPSAGSPPEASLEPKSVKATLTLDKIFEANQPLYPGYKALVGYRYSFEGDIDLQQEVVPLLDLSQFKKLGEKRIEDRQEGSLSIREITQAIEFTTPGKFQVPQSTISGYAYLDRGWGPKTYIQPLLQSNVAGFEVVVNPFPESLKPPFFYGAIGPFKMKSQLEKPPQLEVGDRFLLKLTIAGPGVISSLKPPNLFCQPNWAGFFEVGDLPPQGQKKEQEVTFAYELRALTQFTSQVPAIFLSYFDPSSSSYKTVSSEATAIKVIPEPLALKTDEKVSEEHVLKTIFNIPENNPPLESLGIFEPQSLFFGSSSTLLLIPLALLLWWVRLTYQEQEGLKKLKPISWQERLSELKKGLSNNDIFAEKAKKFIKEKWGVGPYPDRVAHLMDNLEALRWGGQGKQDGSIYYRELEQLCMQNGKLKSTEG